MCHRVPAGPAPVLASDFHHSRPASQGVQQQAKAAQAKSAEPLPHAAPTAAPHAQEPQQSIAPALPLQADQHAAPSVAPAQQLKQDTDSGITPLTTKVPSGYAALLAGPACYWLRGHMLELRQTVSLSHCL